ncbi:MAG: DMT family transporter [Candidatus Aminicenantes bacterium]|nr:DMT family transporter [Candidatus Aminicenantes bacterium]
MEEYKKFGATDLFMLLAVLFWAINFPFIKIALREFSPLGFNGIRLFLSALVLIIVLLASGEGFALSKSDLWKLMVLGIIGNTFFQLFFIHGINWTTASNTAIIMAMTPVFIALLSVLLKHEKIHRIAWIGILVSFIGFYFVITKTGAFHFSWQNMKGDLMIFSGNLFWAVYTVLSRSFLKRISPLKFVSITLAFGALFYLPFSVRSIIQLDWNGLSFKAWAGLVYSALFAICISYIFWYSSVKRVGNTKTAIYGNITPVLTIVFAYIFLSEKITLLQAGGTLIILLGVYLARSGYRLFEDSG